MLRATVSNGWLVVALVLVRSVHCYLPGTGSYIAGNLSAAAPYGIPPDEFGNVTERVFSTATYNMTGYDVSTGTGPREQAGWTLTVNITTDVSLINAANHSNFDIEATTLSIQPPGGNVTLHPSWKVCAVVYSGLVNDISPSTNINGTCGTVLSNSCIQAMESGSSGMDENGTCTTYTLPSVCTSFFPAEYANNSAFAIDQNIMDTNRFYVYGSPTTQTANVTAYEEAMDNVWPVITLFRHSSSNGTGTTLNTTVQCLRASSANTTAQPFPASQSETGQSGVSNLLARPGLSLLASFATIYFLW